MMALQMENYYMSYSLFSYYFSSSYIFKVYLRVNQFLKFQKYDSVFENCSDFEGLVVTILNHFQFEIFILSRIE